MADGSKIEWTDATWNVITGCSVVSPGCTNCYAMRLAGTRLRNDPSRAGLTQASKTGPVWNGQVRFNEQWLDQPLRWRRPRRIFVAAHGDLFHEAVPDEWIDRVFAVMALAPQHTFQVLTKRSARMRAYLTHDGGFGRWGYIEHRARQIADLRGVVIPSTKTLATYGERYLPNVWFGVSTEDQRRADERIPDLLATPAAIRFLSAEPLLGPIDLRAIRWGHSNALMRLDWIIAGGESGPAARPMHPDWARSLRDQCAAARRAFFLKQWGEWVSLESGDGYWPITGRSAVRLQPDGTQGADGWPMHRVGKKAAGRLLDGRTHDDMPEVRA
jgi:protein gp37